MRKRQGVDRIIYRRFFFSSAVLILIPMFVIHIYSISLFSAMKAERLNRVDVRLSQLVERMELELAAIDQCNDSFVCFNAPIQQALFPTDAQREQFALTLWNAYASAKSVFMSLERVSAVALIQPENDVILSASSAHCGLYTFYLANFNRNGLGYDAWFTRAFTPNGPRLYIDSTVTFSNQALQTEPKLCYRSYRNISGGTSGGYYLLAWYTLSDFLPTLEYALDEGELISLRNERGEMLANFSTDARLADTAFLSMRSESETAHSNDAAEYVANRVSDRYGFCLTSTIPWRILTQDIRHRERLLYLTEILVLAVSCLVCASITRRSSAPIQEIGRLVDRDAENPLERLGYQKMMSSILTAVRIQRDGCDASVRQAGAMRQLLIERLTKYAASPDKQFWEIAEAVGLNLTASAYAIVCVCWDRLSQGSQIQEQMLQGGIHDLVTSVLHENSYGYVNESGDSVLLLTLRAADARKTLVHALCKALDNVCNLEYYLGVSGTSERMEELSTLYQCSLEAAKEARQSERYVIYYDEDMDPTRVSYDYPVNLENRLVLSIRRGMRADALSTLAEVIALNERAGEMNASTRTLLYSELLGTAYKAADGLENPFLLRMALTRLRRVNVNQWALTPDSPQGGLCEALGEICDEIAKNDTPKCVEPRKSVREYIEQRYVDADFGIVDIQEYFGVSAATATQYCKDELGDTFTHYLEALRLGKACELVQTGQITIREISRDVGYASYASFSRAFKRHTGVSPKEYREINGTNVP